ncbi:MAG: hypothetical protein ACHREM_24145 [Polyangiales bacterium]
MRPRFAPIDDPRADLTRRQTRAAEIVADALIALMVKERLAEREVVAADVASPEATAADLLTQATIGKSRRTRAMIAAALEGRSVAAE